MRIIIILLASFVLVACASDGKRQNGQQSETEIYQKAVQAIDDDNYFLAVESLQKLENRYPYGKYSEQAQLEMIYAQYKAQELPGAQATAKRFIRLHADHDNVDYAHYLKALITYEQGLSLVERYFANEQSHRDAQPARDAFQAFAELIHKFPNSEYAPDARQRMIYLRDRLALHEVHVGNYYLKRHAYLAATNRGRTVVEKFQGSDQVANGLALMIEGYELLGQQDLADKSLLVLKENFPAHKQLEDGKFVHSGWAQVDHRSIWNVVTFGLLD